MTLACLHRSQATLRRSEAQNPGVTRDAKRELPSPRLGPGRPPELVLPIAERRCVCGKVPHLGPCDEAKDRLCARGCGNPVHRGFCVGQNNAHGRRKRSADPAAVVEKVLAVLPKPTAFSEIAERLVAAGYGEPAAGVTRVRAEDVPSVCLYRSPSGRIAQIWAELLACAPSERVRIDESSVVRAGSMASQLRGKAKRMGRQVDYRRDGNTLYAWLLPMDAKSGSEIMSRIGAQTEQVG
jgi:hypothetical protein